MTAKSLWRFWAPLWVIGTVSLLLGYGGLVDCGWSSLVLFYHMLVGLPGFAPSLQGGDSLYSPKSLGFLPPFWDSSQKARHQILSGLYLLTCFHHICSSSSSPQPGETFFLIYTNVLLRFCSSYILDEPRTASCPHNAENFRTKAKK